MTVSTSDYALLSQNAYQTPVKGQRVELGGVSYKALDYADTGTGFQATAYERLDTHEVIIAYRGTEFDREPLKDGGTDAGMVIAGVNVQSPDAIAFTQRVLDQVHALEKETGPMPVTVTGHSLGGTLAEINASKFGLKGETFNAYGAAGLWQGVPEGGHQVIDHVRATDVVSAASPHFGEVRTYAVQQDIDTLTKAGYRDDSTLSSPRNPFKAIDFNAHAIDNFVPDSKLLGHSIVGPQGEALYREHQQMIDRYRNDVGDLRKGLSLGWEIPKTIVDAGEAVGHTVAEKATEGWHAATHVAHEAVEAAERAGTAVKNEVVRDVAAVEHAATSAAHRVGDAARNVAAGAEHAFESAGKALHAAEEATSEKASKVFDTLSHPGSWFDNKPAAEKSMLNEATHPDHALFQQARGAVQQLDASHQRSSDQRSDNLAAALTVAARQGGMNQIHHVVLSDDASRAYAVEGDIKSPFKRIAQVDTAQAMATPIERSSATWQQQAQPQAGHALAQNAPTQQLQQNTPMAGP
ncbi:XVIPCD domain-containing protein [Dyella terrae]|uniref:XVIPCD domain-containing protein n=1 Tax=Dyella terrae TaxID=522259 RepID=UPI001EFE2A3A|nr:XVIPCD domain-containing protein [Dyella terrae]ULU26916.1 Lipase protein [Dyella terrae]